MPTVKYNNAQIIHIENTVYTGIVTVSLSPTTSATATSSSDLESESSQY